MGLLDALFSNDSGGGLLGGLPQSWQWQNPADANSNKDFLAALQQDPSMGNNLVAPQSPFGAVPNFAQQPQSVFAGGAAPVQSGFNPALLTPQAPQMQPQPQQPAPMPQQAPPAPQMAPPQDMPDRTMNVGGYQMPQFGAPPQMAQAPSTDISAQSRQPQPDQALPPALQDRSLLSRIGSPDGLIARLTGNDTRSISQQNLTAQYHALRQTLQDNGDTPQAAASKAMIAVMNPEAAKTILPELFTTKEKAQKLTDSFGNERIVFSNEREGTTHEANSASGFGSASPAASDFGQIADNVAKARAAGASKAELLQQIPAMYRGYVDSILQDKALPTNMGRGKARMAILGLAHEVDPNFNEELIPTRIQMRKDFAGEGKNGQAIGAFNTVQHHAGQVSDAIEEFQKAGGGSDYPLLNAGKLLLANNTGANPQLRDAAQKLQDKLNATEHEVASAYNAGHITDSDRKTWNEIKASNLPANQLRQKLDDFVELLNGKRDSLNHMYQQTFHEDAPTIDKETNAAITAKIHGRLPGYAKEQAPPSGNQTKTGVTWSVVK